MSNNMPRKLQIKAELLRHLVTVDKMVKEDKPSSVVKALFLAADYYAFEEHGQEPDLAFWEKYLAEQ